MLYRVIFISANLLVNLLMAVMLGKNILTAFAAYIHADTAFWAVLVAISMTHAVAYFSLRRKLQWISSIIFTIFVISFVTALIVDTVWLILHIYPLRALLELFNEHILYVGVVCIILSMIHLTRGFFNAYVPKIAYHTVVISKKIKKPFRIAFISDIHLKNYTSAKYVRRMVDMINSLDADLVLFAGDIADLSAKSFIEHGFDKEFLRINSKYGVFAALGNHEYYNISMDDILVSYAKSGLQLLRDEVYPLNQLGVVLIGRDDYSSSTFGVARLSLKELSKGLDVGMPKIVLEHQPRRDAIQEAQVAEVDLQLSGHTHAGQIFPINLLIDSIYKNPWGYWAKNGYNLLVSCGFGTWGINARSYSRSEIMCIDVTRGEKVPSVKLASVAN